MSLVERVGGSKKKYTLIEDVVIVKGLKNGLDIDGVVKLLKKCGFERTKASTEYRIYRVLTKVDKFSDIYKDLKDEELKKVQLEADKLMK